MFGLGSRDELKSLCVAVALTMLVACGGGSPTPAPMHRAAPPSGPPAPASSTPRLDPALAEKVDALVEEGTRTGVIARVDVNGHEALVNPISWAIWNADTKKAFTMGLAIYCDHQSAYHGIYVDILDSQSGKKIAHYGPWGFEVF
jgi:hypothetical protein